MNEEMSDLPQAETADPDGVQVALRAAHTLWSRGDTTESLKWLRMAAESASDEGADLRSLQLAKAAAELRAKLFRPSEPPRAPSAAHADQSGAHPIVAPGAESDAARAATSSALPTAEAHSPGAGSAYAAGAVSYASPGAAEENTHVSVQQPVVTATQYPSHRPRQRMGLNSGIPGSRPPASGALGASGSSSPGPSGREGAYAAVPSWSADSERRVSSAPPPLPQQSLDDYEELEAEPDEEPADDPGSVWSADAGFESWRPPEPVPPSAPKGTLPPPLPLRGAFAEDEADFAQQPDPTTVVIPPVDENEAEGRSGARRASSSGPQQSSGQFAAGGAYAGSGFAGSGFAGQGSAWDQQARVPGWDPDADSASWAAELRNGTWGNLHSGGNNAVDEEVGNGSSPGATSVAGLGLEPTNIEPPPQSETAPAKLTARVHHQAVRVSFAPDLRVPGQYVVRPLREGERAATGERIALLVALEPGVPLV